VPFLGEGVAATSLSYPADKRGEIEKEGWSHATDYSSAGDPGQGDGKL
jgi:hypothetical protein